MSDLKNCPFCGGEVYRNHDILVIDCVKCERRFDFEGDIGIADWNRRPLEDALSKRIAELEAALRKILECSTVLDCDDYQVNGRGYDCEEVEEIVREALKGGE